MANIYTSHMNIEYFITKFTRRYRKLAYFLLGMSNLVLSFVYFYLASFKYKLASRVIRCN